MFPDSRSPDQWVVVTIDTATGPELGLDAFEHATPPILAGPFFHEDTAQAACRCLSTTRGLPIYDGRDPNTPRLDPHHTPRKDDCS